jgi:prepilin-type N-terminal cleavage/methylation domain-containing protein
MRSDGFTLLEVAVVLAILGIALAVAAPAPPRNATGDARAERVLLLRRGRALAAREGGEVTVAVDGTRYRVWLRRATVDSLVERGAIETPGAPLQIRFDPLGRATPDADGGIVVDRWNGAVDSRAP